jgi:hypothetical protein
MAKFLHRKVSRAVHEAVCEVSGTDGFRMCRSYAVTCWLLLQSLGYRNGAPQAGMLALLGDPADPTGWFAMGPGQNPAGNELHCWTVLGQGPPPVGLNVKL